MDSRKTNTHPSKRGADQETHWIDNRWGESDTANNQTKAGLQRETFRRGEDEIAKIVCPM